LINGQNINQIKHLISLGLQQPPGISERLKTDLKKAGHPSGMVCKWLPE